MSPVPAFVAYVVVDQETINFGANPFADPPRIPSCWQKVTLLQPVGLGWGTSVFDFASQRLQSLSGGAAASLNNKLERYFHPKPAFLYGIPPACDEPVGNSASIPNAAAA